MECNDKMLHNDIVPDFGRALDTMAKCYPIVWLKQKAVMKWKPYLLTCASFCLFLGAIRDSSGSYIGSFHMIGTCLIMAALVLLLEPLARKFHNRSSETTNNTGDMTLELG